LYITVTRDLSEGLLTYQPLPLTRVDLGLAIHGLVEVRPCPHGRGLFASRDFEKDSVIRQFDDIVLTSRPTSSPHGKYALRIGEDEYWEGFPVGSPDRWSNFIDHADDPNAVFVIEKKRKRACFKAMKRIVRGEEIFINYMGYYYSNPTYHD
jgi:hypothetical protein